LQGPGWPSPRIPWEAVMQAMHAMQCWIYSFPLTADMIKQQASSPLFSQIDQGEVPKDKSHGMIINTSLLWYFPWLGIYHQLCPPQQSDQNLTILSYSTQDEPV
jgi:hypothetical protein